MTVRVERGPGWSLYLGDCVEVMRSLDRVDVTITDPPYEDEAHTKQRRVRSKNDGAAWRKGRRAKLEVVPINFAPLTEELRKEAARHFARLTQRWVVVFCQIEGATRWRDVGRAAGLKHRRVGLWIKPDGMPQLSGDRPGVGYEAIEIMHPRGRSRWNGGGKHAVWVHNTRWRPELGGGGYRRGGRGEMEDHDTTKPLALMLDLVSDFSDVGELVLDAFMGSATTGVACIRLGRRFVGIESDPKSFDLAVERLRAEGEGSTLQAARAEQGLLFNRRIA